MKTLVDIQIQGIDPPIPVEICIGIVVGITHARAVGLLVQVQIQRVGTAVVVQIPVTQVAITITICVTLIRIDKLDTEVGAAEADRVEPSTTIRGGTPRGVTR
jgi:hypothetical protein